MTSERDGYYRHLRSFFDDIARTKGGYYDTRPGSKRPGHTPWQQLNRGHIKRVLSSLARTRTLRSFLDVGCGMGDFAHELTERFDFQRGQGIDLSSGAIDIAQEQYGSGETTRLSFSVEDVASGLSFSDREFDIVCCLNAFHHILPADQKAVIGHLCRVANQAVVIEIKRYHVLHRLLNGYKAMGVLDYYPVRISEVLPWSADHGFRPFVIHPIFYARVLSPIAILTLVRTEET